MNSLCRFILIACMGLLSGCAFLVESVNEKWPPVDPTINRDLAVVESYTALKAMASPNFQATLSAADIDAHVIPKLLVLLEKLPAIKGLEGVRLSNVQFGLAEQGATIEAEFALTLTEYRLNLTGRLTGEVAVSTSQDALMFRPAFRRLILSKVNRDAERAMESNIGREVATKLVNAALRTFLDNLNGKVFAKPITVAIEIPPFELSGGRHTVRGAVVDHGNIGLSLDMSGATVLVDRKGIAVMASLINGRAIGAPIKHVAGVSFDDFRSRFLAQSVASFPQLDGSSVLVEKSLVASAFNKAMDGANVEIEMANFLTIPPDKQNFSKPIRIGALHHRLNCDGIPRDQCNGPCSIRVCACNQSNLVSRTACLATHMPPCVVAQTAERAACAACRTTAEAEQIARRGACRIERETVRIIDQAAHLGELRGEVRVTESTLNSRLHQISVSPDLTHANLKTDVSSSARIWLRLHVDPDRAGHLLCVFNFRTTLEPIVRFNQTGLVLSGALTSRYDNGQLFVDITTAPLAIDAQLSPVPYLLLVSDPGFLMNCSILNLVTTVVSAEEILRTGDLPDALRPIMTGQMRVDVSPKTLRLRIPEAKVDGVALRPEWSPNHIGFRRLMSP